MRETLENICRNLDSHLTEERVSLMRKAIPPGSAAESAEQMYRVQAVAGSLCEIKDMVFALYELREKFKVEIGRGGGEAGGPEGEVQGRDREGEEGAGTGGSRIDR